MKYITKIKEGQTTEDVSSFISQIATEHNIIYESVIDTICMDEVTNLIPDAIETIRKIFSPYGMLYFENSPKNKGLLGKITDSGKFDFITTDTDVDFNFKKRKSNYEEIDIEEPPFLNLMGYDIEAFKAFENQYEEKPIIAIADTGIDFNNNFLKNSLWVNENYNNSFGFNFTESNNWNCFNTYDDFLSRPERGHGTKVTSIISSSVKDKVIGVFPSAKILTLKVFPKSERSFSQIVKALIFAALNGAQVINCSFNIPEIRESPELKDVFDRVLEFLKEKKCIPVFSVPNREYSIKNVYPQNSCKVISVSSVDWDKNLPRRTAWGKNVDIWAVGEHIKCFTSDNKKAIYDSGTSFATPFVTATIAMLKTIRPELDIDTIKSILTESGTDIEIHRYPYNVKLLNIGKALKSITN